MANQLKDQMDLVHKVDENSHKNPQLTLEERVSTELKQNGSVLLELDEFLEWSESIRKKRARTKKV